MDKIKVDKSMPTLNQEKIVAEIEKLMGLGDYKVDNQ